MIRSAVRRCGDALIGSPPDMGDPPASGFPLNISRRRHRLAALSLHLDRLLQQGLAPLAPVVEEEQIRAGAPRQHAEETVGDLAALSCGSVGVPARSLA